MARNAFLLAAIPLLARAGCPFGGHGEPPAGHPSVLSRSKLQEYQRAVVELDIDAVKSDLKELLRSSQDFWPADFGNYGPLFVRLAWHCAGSYRASDGRGGCEGGRQRFDPERSWADNTNLDKARTLLAPIKVKYGHALSWGDLIVLAGTTAIEAMGGPVLGFCGGRVDDDDGSASVELGPSPLQEELYPCPLNGTCKKPLGTTTVGLIYLNPEGPMGQPIPEESAKDIRDAFGRMGMNDSETVALIGGGHAFGKAHGPCPNGAGPSPKEDPLNPWPGMCGTGKGMDTFTSGFELQWTNEPTKWSNGYFKVLLGNEWEKFKGPGGHWQWRIKGASGGQLKLGMLTSDVGLLMDSEYKRIAQSFAQDQAPLDDAFAHVWYKLMTRDMGPVTRCVGKYVPPAQAFQNPLPPPPAKPAKVAAVKARIVQLIGTSQTAFPSDVYDGSPSYAPLFVNLAYRCAATFRATDWLGGCNGARLRFSPERDWPANADLDKALEVLKPIKEEFGASLTWADLIALAGTTAIEVSGGQRMTFCAGRSDASDGAGSAYLNEGVQPNVTSPDVLKNAMRIMGLSYREFVVLMGGGHSLGQMHSSRSGYEGSWTRTPTKLDNAYFRTLVLEQWEVYSVAATGKIQYKAQGKDLFMLNVDMLLRADGELLAIAQEYAADEALFQEDFARAWTKLMNADRFDGPAGNLCDRDDDDAGHASLLQEGTPGALRR